MNNVLEYGLLGLGAGAAYVLLAQGVILVYRVSGVVNFAQGALAMFGAYAYYELRGSVGFTAAVLLALLLTGVLGLCIYQLLMRPLRSASPLTGAIATLGVLAVLQAIATIHYQSNDINLPINLPHEPIRFGSIVVPADQLWMCGIAIVLTGVLAALSRYTMLGLATTAVSENEISASALGWSPTQVSSISWFVSSVLAAGAGILIAPLSGLNVTVLVLLVVPALATSLMGDFSSFTLTLVGGLVLGILQSEMQNYVRAVGWPDAIPFIVIAVVLIVRGRAVPLRSEVVERRPALGNGTIRPLPLVVCTVALALLVEFAFPVSWVADLSTSFIFAIVLLSAVVLTGYAGQLSLAQFGVGGVGTLIAAKLCANHVPFPAAFVVGVLSAALSGLILGLPALRTRGVNLAVITLGLGVAVQAVVFNNAHYVGGGFGTEVGKVTLFGLNLDPIVHPRTYAILSLVVLVVVAVAVCNVRRGVAGRRLIAVRTNERAAASLGVNVFGAKLYAFVVAAGIAGAGCILYGFQGESVTYANFEPFHSISVVTLAVVGGIGYVAGAPLGATLAAGGVGTIITNAIFGSNDDQWLALVGGVFLLLILLQNANGLADQSVKQLRGLLRRLRRSTPEQRDGQAKAGITRAGGLHQVKPLGLHIEDVTVRFGAVVAVDRVGFDLEPGQIVGLIGPNGAGKTTLIDAITGFVRVAEGKVELGGQAVDKWAAHRRVRAGMTRSFQSLELFDDITVRENLSAAADPHGLLPYVRDLVFPRREALSGAAAAVIEEFHLEADLDKRPNEISYGERRLLAIARSVAARPSVLLLDEPAAGLGPSESAELVTMLRKLAKEWGIAIVLVEHDMSVIMEVSDRVLVLEFGRKIADGAPEEISRDPAVLRAYLGEHAGWAELDGPSAATEMATNPPPDTTPLAR